MPSSPATSSASTRATTRPRGWTSHYLSGGPDVIPESALIAGKADLTLTTPDTTVSAIVDQGAKFKIIGAQYQKNPVGIVSLAKNPIKTPADLVGKTLAVPPVNVISVEAMLKLNKIDKDKVRIVPYEYDPDAADQGRDRCLARFHHQRALHDRAGGREGDLVPALRLRLHHLQRHGGRDRGHAEGEAQGDWSPGSGRAGKGGPTISSTRPSGRRNSPTPGTRAPAARSRMRSISTRPRSH